ncbi:MAG TPA: efflux RND transporter periplasmic adaptor subunit [Desulfonatronum sp.]|nr:efflux RND transporter periplasmic adaptor subunit [Desulfonatronum sp.]
MNPSQPSALHQEKSLHQLLDSQSKGRRQRRWLWLGLALTIIAGAGLLFLRTGEEPAEARYATAPAEIGTLVVTVSATGNLRPTNTVEVGSELSGIVDQVLVEVNDQVNAGQVLARLDPAKLQDAVARARANLAVAEAQVLQAGATVDEARITLERYQQVAELSGGKVPSKTEMDGAEADLKRAVAALASARAGVTQAQANLQSDETDLDKAGIRSPIHGVVLTREVEPGQTVAASFQAPVLFTLAEDLAKMELQVDVDEADVGQVQAEQNATFTVDAWPGRKYAAIITRVSYGSQEKDNVVSYLTVLAVDNQDCSLRPGMTGTAEISTVRRENVLLVPNAALRFTPASPDTGPKRSTKNVVSALMPRPPRQGRQVQAAANGAPRVWVQRDGELTALAVQTGVSNGRMTEIISGELQAGMQVITEDLGGS